MLLSFAQNQEDVMLWRALKHVEQGFYIDVGAADPVDLSVTHLFSSKGWYGINLEPEPEHFKTLSAARTRDINLAVCAASENGEAVFYQIPETGLSTTRGDVAREHEKAGFPQNELRVPTRTLADICKEHAYERDIHFLKIDVEGGEADVLRGADFERFRPWIIVIEATLPMTQVADYLGWESLVTDAGYRFAWFDGVNRFYVAQERSDALLPHFTVPPNIFDGFTRAADLIEPLARAETDRGEADKRATVAEAKLLDAEAKNRRLTLQFEALQSKLLDGQRAARETDRRAEALESQLAANAQHVAQISAQLKQAISMREAADRNAAAVRASTSWRITRPIRGIGHIAKGRLSLRQALDIIRGRKLAPVPSVAAGDPTIAAAHEISRSETDIQRIADIQQAILAEIAAQRQQNREGRDEIRQLAAEMERVLVTLAMEAGSAKNDL